jgi:hypothetical protein
LRLRDLPLEAMLREGRVYGGGLHKLEPKELANVSAESIAAIGLTGQMHGLVLLDGAGAVLRPAILWNDQRTAAECELIRTAVGAERLVELTGNDALTGFTAPKLVWVREHEPEIDDDGVQRPLSIERLGADLALGGNVSEQHPERYPSGPRRIPDLCL